MALKPPGCAAEGGAQCRWGLGLTPRRRARNRNSSVRTWPPTRRRRPCSATVHGTPAARRLRPPALVPRLECVGLRWFLLSGTGEAGPDSADYLGAVPPTSPGEDGGGGRTATERVRAWHADPSSSGRRSRQPVQVLESAGRWPGGAA